MNILEMECSLLACRNSNVFKLMKFTFLSALDVN